jgi:hypothetical protein
MKLPLKKRLKIEAISFGVLKFESSSRLKELQSKSYDCYAIIKAQKDIKK